MMGTARKTLSMQIMAIQEPVLLTGMVEQQNVRCFTTK